MGKKVIRSIEDFAAAVEIWGTDAKQDQERALDKSATRLRSALRPAVARLAGSDGVLSGSAGHNRRPIKLGFKITKSYTSGNVGLVARGTGGWQIRDNTIKGGPTQPHYIGPNNRRNPRPLPPATGRYDRKALKIEGGAGGFAAGSPIAGQNYILHGGSTREPAWRNAIQYVQPQIIGEHKRTFDTTTAKRFGG